MERLLAGLVLPALMSLACATSTGESPDVATAPAIALAAEGRPAADLARDAGRKPAEVIAFLGVEPGMTALDLLAAGGYYTEVLSVAVGPTGRVYSQNGEFLLKLRDGMFDKALTERLADNRLPNVVRLDRELGDLGLEAESVDVVMTALNYHDIANSRGPEAAARFLATAHGLLKPGGVLGLIDHNGRVGQDNKEVHRIPVADVIQAAEAAGFEVEAQGDMLRNPADDLTQNVFSPAIRGQTDRFVLRLRKAS